MSAPTPGRAARRKRQSVLDVLLRRETEKKEESSTAAESAGEGGAAAAAAAAAGGASAGSGAAAGQRSAFRPLSSSARAASGGEEKAEGREALVTVVYEHQRRSLSSGWGPQHLKAGPEGADDPERYVNVVGRPRRAGSAFFDVAPQPPHGWKWAGSWQLVMPTEQEVGVLPVLSQNEDGKEDDEGEGKGERDGKTSASQQQDPEGWLYAPSFAEFEKPLGQPGRLVSRNEASSGSGRPESGGQRAAPRVTRRRRWERRIVRMTATEIQALDDESERKLLEHRRRRPGNGGENGAGDDDIDETVTLTEMDMADQERLDRLTLSSDANLLDDPFDIDDDDDDDEEDGERTPIPQSLRSAAHLREELVGGKIKDPQLLATGRQIRAVEAECEQADQDEKKDLDGIHRRELKKHILEIEKQVKVLQKRLEKEADRGWQHIETLENDISAHVDTLEEMKKNYHFPRSKIRTGGNGVYLALEDLWIETCTGQFILDLVPNDRLPQIILHLCGLTSGQDSGLTVSIMLEGFRLRGDRGSSVPPLDFKKVAVTAVVRVTMSLQYDAERERWAPSPNTIRIEMIQFHGPFGTRKNLVSTVINLVTPLIRRQIVSVLPEELGNFLHPSSMRRPFCIRGQFAIEGSSLDMLGKTIYRERDALSAVGWTNEQALHWVAFQHAIGRKSKSDLMKSILSMVHYRKFLLRHQERGEALISLWEGAVDLYCKKIPGATGFRFADLLCTAEKVMRKPVKLNFSLQYIDGEININHALHHAHELLQKIVEATMSSSSESKGMAGRARQHSAAAAVVSSSTTGAATATGAPEPQTQSRRLGFGFGSSHTTNEPRGNTGRTMKKLYSKLQFLGRFLRQLGNMHKMYTDAIAALQTLAALIDRVETEVLAQIRGGAHSGALRARINDIRLQGALSLHLKMIPFVFGFRRPLPFLMDLSSRPDGSLDVLIRQVVPHVSALAPREQVSSVVTHRKRVVNGSVVVQRRPFSAGATPTAGSSNLGGPPGLSYSSGAVATSTTSAADELVPVLVEENLGSDAETYKRFRASRHHTSAYNRLSSLNARPAELPQAPTQSLLAAKAQEDARAAGGGRLSRVTEVSHEGSRPELLRTASDTDAAGEPHDGAGGGTAGPLSSWTSPARSLFGSKKTPGRVVRMKAAARATTSSGATTLRTAAASGNAQTEHSTDTASQASSSGQVSTEDTKSRSESPYPPSSNGDTSAPAVAVAVPSPPTLSPVPGLEDDGNGDTDGAGAGDDFSEAGGHAVPHAGHVSSMYKDVLLAVVHRPRMGFVASSSTLGKMAKRHKPRPGSSDTSAPGGRGGGSGGAADGGAAAEQSVDVPLFEFGVGPCSQQTMKPPPTVTMDELMGDFGDLDQRESTGDGDDDDELPELAQETDPDLVCDMAAVHVLSATGVRMRAHVRRVDVYAPLMVFWDFLLGFMADPSKFHHYLPVGAPGIPLLEVVREALHRIRKYLARESFYVACLMDIALLSQRGDMVVSVGTPAAIRDGARRPNDAGRDSADTNPADHRESAEGKSSGSSHRAKPLQVRLHFDVVEVVEDATQLLTMFMRATDKEEREAASGSNDG